MDKNTLLKFFRTNEKIGEYTGQCKQNVHKTVYFTNPNRVKLLMKALEVKFKELTIDYSELMDQGEEVLKDAKIKAKRKR